MAEQEDITLAIISRNAEDTLPRVLDAVDNLTLTPETVLCVDGNSTDATPEIIENHPSAELVRQREGGRSTARNIAVDRTTTPLLAFLDADAAPKPDWLEVLNKLLHKKEVAAIGGLVMERISTISDGWRYKHLGLNFGRNVGYVDGVAANNVLFRISALRDVGEWRGHVSEDLDMCNRLIEAGYRIYYTDEAVVDHIRTDTPESVLGTVWDYHFTDGDEPESVTDIPRRFFLHVAKTGLYAFQDIQRGTWDLLPVTLQLPYVHTRRDIEYLRSQR